MSRMTDAEMLEAYRATQDRNLLNNLFARHYPTIYHVVLKLVRNSTDAGDLTQSAFLKAVESAESFRPTGSLRNWVLTIAINEVRQFRRGAVRRNRPEALHELSRKSRVEPPLDSDLLRREFEEHLEQALEQFPDELKDPLVLHYYQNLSYAESAEILGIPKSTLQFRMEQALHKLREEFKKRGLLSLMAQFFPAKRLARPLSWGAAIMTTKALGALLIFCGLFAAGSVAWRATASRRTGAPADSARRASSRAQADAAPGAALKAADAEGIGIFGRVVEKASDSPIAGATISAYDFENGSTDQTLSDEKGRFRLTAADGSARTYHLRVARQGYASINLRSVAAMPAPVTLALSQGGSITGRVEDSDGIPLSPYRVVAVRRQFEKGFYDFHAALYRLGLPKDWLPEEAEVRYSPDGRFEIRNLSAGGYVLLFEKEGSFPFVHPEDSYPTDGRVDVKEGESTDVRVLRLPLGIVRIRAIDRETREPLAGVRISNVLYVDRYKMPCDEKLRLTDELGLCELPAALDKRGNLDSVNVVATKAGYAPTHLSIGGNPNGYVAEAEMAKPARIKGQVRNRDGSPVERAAVYVEREVDGFLSALCFTDADGRYSADGLNAPEKYAVFVYDRRLNRSRSATHLLLREGETREANFGSSSGASLSGVLTLKGQPRPLASVCVDGPGRHDRLIVYTNEQGEYQVEGLAPGSFELGASVPTGKDRWISVTRRITLADGERRKEDFDSGALTIRGTACDSATLQPLPKGKSLLARRVDGEGTPDEISVNTTDQGRFEFVLPRPGVYQLDADREVGEYSGSNEPKVDLTSLSSVDDVRLLLHRDTSDGKIALRIVDATTGKPIPEGSFHWSSGNCWGAGSFGEAGLSDGELRIGTHRYEVSADDYVPMQVTLDITATQRQAEATIKLVKSDAVLVKQVLPSSPAEKAGLQIGDLLVSYDGKPLPNVASLRAIAGEVPVSQKVALEIRRGNETRVLIVPGKTLGIEAQNASRR